MVIASYGPYTFAGFYLTPEDFEVVGGDLVAVRQFRYTVNQGEAASGPPNLGIAYVPIQVPEPATALLLALALGLAAAATRRPNPCP